MNLNAPATITVDDTRLTRTQRAYKGMAGVIKATGVKTVCIQYPCGELVHVSKELVK